MNTKNTIAAPISPRRERNHEDALPIGTGGKNCLEFRRMGGVRLSWQQS